MLGRSRLNRMPEVSRGRTTERSSSARAQDRRREWPTAGSILASGTRPRQCVQDHAEVPPGTESFVAVRASADGQRWSEWEWDVADGAIIPFEDAQRWLQYRVVLLGGADRTPTVSKVQLTPQPNEQTGTSPARRKAGGLAPTYRLRITRMGMVGSRTANGHRVKARDFMVALPSWKSLSSRRGGEYMVRLSANGRSVVVPVMDVGPWNRQDNYWAVKRERYKDLPVGWPQDHAAYYERYNNRRSEKGRVRFPSAVDVGDGAYWALGLKGVQATVDVTFLWLGADPGPNPAPLNSRSSQRP